MLGNRIRHLQPSTSNGLCLVALWQQPVISGSQLLILGALLTSTAILAGPLARLCFTRQQSACYSCLTTLSLWPCGSDWTLPGSQKADAPTDSLMVVFVDTPCVGGLTSTAAVVHWEPERVSDTTLWSMNGVAFCKQPVGTS